MSQYRGMQISVMPIAFYGWHWKVICKGEVMGKGDRGLPTRSQAITAAVDYINRLRERSA